MQKVTPFLLLILCAIFLFAGTVIAVQPDRSSDDPILIKPQALSGKAVQHLQRDEDEFMTYRFRVSDDGAETWSEIIGLGDAGMREDGEQGWGAASYDFGVVVDNANVIHFVAILNAFDPEDNPLDRVNGVYDVSSDAAGENVTYTLITAQPDNAVFTWSDAGIDAAGEGYAIWIGTVTEGEVVSQCIWAARTTQGDWGDPVVIAEGLSMEDHFPSMTYWVGDYFYVLYQEPNAESGLFDQFILKVPASLDGEVVTLDPGAASGTYVSYYTSNSNPIDQDVEAGYIYFVIRSADLSGVAVGYSDDGGDSWTIEAVNGAQRYPSVALDLAGGIPWVFSNFGVTTPHSNWYAYDAIGYGGGDWVGPDTLTTIAAGELLYNHLGVITTTGRVVSGCNVWNYPDPVLTPTGFMVRYTDDVGESWSDSSRIVNCWSDGFNAAYLPQICMVPGQENYVWTVFCGQYGETDIEAPVVGAVVLSAFGLEEVNVVTAAVTDNQEVATVMLNWAYWGPDALFWDYTGVPDNTNVDENGNGMYYFHIPHEIAISANETRQLENGDRVMFYVDALDAAGGYGYSAEYYWIVGEGWDNAPADNVAPTNYELGQNFPNPFNNSTMIPFSLDRAADVTLSIYNINGRLVETVFEGRATAGRHEVAWRGDGVVSGVYLYVLETTDHQRFVGKMTLIR